MNNCFSIYYAGKFTHNTKGAILLIYLVILLEFRNPRAAPLRQSNLQSQQCMLGRTCDLQAESVMQFLKQTMWHKSHFLKRQSQLKCFLRNSNLSEIKMMFTQAI